MNPTATNPLTESIDKKHHGEMCLDLPTVVGTPVSATCESMDDVKLMLILIMFICIDIHSI